MIRLVILIVSLVWASLLLISWSGATPVLENQQEQQVATNSRS